MLSEMHKTIVDRILMFQKNFLAFKSVKDLSTILVNIHLLTINLLNGLRGISSSGRRKDERLPQTNTPNTDRYCSL